VIRLVTVFRATCVQKLCRNKNRSWIIALRLVAVTNCVNDVVSFMLFFCIHMRYYLPFYYSILLQLKNLTTPRSREQVCTVPKQFLCVTSFFGVLMCDIIYDMHGRCVMVIRASLRAKLWYVTV